MINKQEIKFISLAAALAFALFMFVIPYFQSKGIDNYNPITQFLIFTIGIFVVIQVFLKAMSLGTRVKILSTLGILCLTTAIDIWQSPFAVSKTGELLTGPVLSKSASDYVAGYIATNIIHLSGIAVFLFTYIVAPLTLLIISARLIPNFVKSV